MKKILIMTSERTGTGHKSAAKALANRLRSYQYDVKVVDAFTLGGRPGMWLENSYERLVNHFPAGWWFTFSFSQVFPDIIHNYIYHIFKKDMLKLIQEYQPDLILSVHVMYTKAISKLLRKNNLKIPFMVNVIDLVDPAKPWFDKNADISFLPTEKVKQQFLAKGFKESQLVVSGFPIREDANISKKPKDYTDKPNILIVNPSIRLRRSLQIINGVSELNANVTVVCGLDHALYTKLKANNNPRYKLYEFVTNMNELLADAHLLICKAGPNMILEGARSGTPILITDHIPGQEAKNYQYIEDLGIGTRSSKPKKVKDHVERLIKTGELKTLLEKVRTTKACVDGVAIISDKIREVLK
ncbi:MAG: hypothetical protein MJ206_03435 [Bacilli bacterium]|nr:hypothetical protein [Bacilli bacterium]